MMSEATAQNGFTDDGSNKYDPYSKNPLDDFQESLNRQILSQLSRQLIGDAFGEDQIKEGRYELGDYVIDISEGAEGVNIYILDNTTGDETTVVVPYL
jgi:curli production assembly/transport component CsgF